jgi:hypothetical protein
MEDRIGEGKMKRLSFNDEMMKAWLEGRKTVTRRLIKKANDPFFGPAASVCPAQVDGYIAWWPIPITLDRTKELYAHGFLPPYRPGETVFIGESKAIIKSIRPERVQEITEEEAIMEGCYHHDSHIMSMATGYKASFFDLWDSLYPGSWDRNDWVWRIELERVG